MILQWYNPSKFYWTETWDKTLSILDNLQSFYPLSYSALSFNTTDQVKQLSWIRNRKGRNWFETFQQILEIYIALFIFKYVVEFLPKIEQDRDQLLVTDIYYRWELSLALLHGDLHRTRGGVHTLNRDGSTNLLSTPSLWLLLLSIFDLVSAKYKPGVLQCSVLQTLTSKCRLWL